MRSCRQCLSRHSVEWGSAGLAPKGRCGGWTTCRRTPGPGVGVLCGIIFQQTGAGSGTSLGFFQPSSPTALAALPFILGQRLLIFLSWLSSLLLKGLNSVWATSHPQQLQEQMLRAAWWETNTFCGARSAPLIAACPAQPHPGCRSGVPGLTCLPSASPGGAPSVGAGCLSCLCVQRLSLLRGSSAWLVFSLLWRSSGTSGKGEFFMEPYAALGLRSWLVSFPPRKEGRTLDRVTGKLAGHRRELCAVVRSFRSL